MGFCNSSHASGAWYLEIFGRGWRIEIEPIGFTSMETKTGRENTRRDDARQAWVARRRMGLSWRREE